MKESIRKSLTSLQEKASELSQQLSDPSITSDISKLTNLNKEFSEIKDVVENWTNYQEIELTISDLEKLLKDEEMKNIATVAPPSTMFLYKDSLTPTWVKLKTCFHKFSKYVLFNL